MAVTASTLYRRGGNARVRWTNDIPTPNEIGDVSLRRDIAIPDATIEAEVIASTTLMLANREISQIKGGLESGQDMSAIALAPQYNALDPLLSEIIVWLHASIDPYLFITAQPITTFVNSNYNVPQIRTLVRLTAPGASNLEITDLISRWGDIFGFQGLLKTWSEKQAELE